MQALGLDIKVLSEDNREIEIKESSEYDDDIPNLESIMDIETQRGSEEQLFSEGFSEEKSPDEEEEEVSFDSYEADDFAMDDFKDE